MSHLNCFKSSHEEAACVLNFDDDKIENAVKNWPCTQAAEFYEEGICKLLKRYDKYFNLNYGYVEK